MPVRNEAWILPYSARAVLTWVDHAIFLDHASTDDTPSILAEIAEEAPGRVLILREPDPTWAEMNHRQRMLEVGRDLGGTHFAIVDADEVLSAHLRERVRAALPIMPKGFTLELPLLNCWRSLDTYRNDTASLFGSAWATLLFRDRTDLSWQPRADGYQHHNRRPINAWPGMRIPPAEPVRRRAAAPAACELAPPGRQASPLQAPGGAALAGAQPGADRPHVQPGAR